MKPLIQLKKATPLIVSALSLACFGLSPLAWAVSPPPDGGYPGFNTAEGQNALFKLNTTSGAANTAVGWFSLKSNVDTSFNTAVGAGTLLFNTADQNTAVGAAALLLNTSGYDDTAVGAAALLNNTVGSFNTAIGFRALSSNTAGGQNTAVGTSALRSNITGTANTAIGDSALFNNDTGYNNTALGFAAGFGVGEAHDVICIGANVSGVNLSNSCFIGNIYGVNEGGTILPVYINESGRLGTQPPSSSRRFKTEIKPMDKASEAIRALKPVTFRYQSDTTGTPQFGLIAEEVAEVNPDLVVRDEKGEIYSVRCDAVNAMLLNEFLKEHRKVEKLEATVADLAATVKAQAARLERVSAQVQMKDSAAQVVANNQ
jgi:Chaperone of endosialidase